MPGEIFRSSLAAKRSVLERGNTIVGSKKEVETIQIFSIPKRDCPVRSTGATLKIDPIVMNGLESGFFCLSNIENVARSLRMEKTIR